MKPGQGRRATQAMGSGLWGFGLLLLVVVLAALQYHWTGELSRAERERAQSRLVDALAQIGRGFDRELTGLLLAFSSDPPDSPPRDRPRDGSGEPTGEQVLRNWDRWSRWASHPEMVRGVYEARFEVDFGSGRPVDLELPLTELDPASATFLPTPWPEALISLRDQLSQQPSLVHRSVSPGDFATLFPFDARRPAIVLPQFARPRRDGRTTTEARIRIVWLDLEALCDGLLGDLAERHLSDAQGRIPFPLAVAEITSGQPMCQLGPAATDGAVDPRPEDALGVDFFKLLGPETVNELEGLRAKPTGPPPGGLPPGGPPPPRSTEEADRAGSERETALRGRFRDRMDRRRGRSFFNPARAFLELGRQPRWRLTLAQPASVLDARFGRARWRNLGISLGILGLLAASGLYLLSATRRAQRLAQTQAELVAGVTHELMTPLAALRSAGQNLADGLVQEEDAVRQYGRLVDGEGRRLSEMVGQMLELAGIAAGNRPFEHQRIEVSPWIDTALADLHGELTHTGMEVELDLAEGLPAVEGDPEALGRALRNLLGNALKYAADGGWIGIEARHSRGEVVLRLADRGPGIEPADLPHVFEPFRRGRGRAASSVPGSGLGLALVQKIVEAHGGQVTVGNGSPTHGDTSQGPGCVVTLRLPAAPASSSSGTLPTSHFAGNGNAG